MNMNIYLFVLLDGLIDSVLAWSAKGRGIESGPTLSIYIYILQVFISSFQMLRMAL